MTSTMVDQVARDVPARTNDEIAAHDAWYRRYVELSEQRRREIAQWKQQREVRTWNCIKY